MSPGETWVGTYVLNGHEPVKATTLEWGRWFEASSRDGSRQVADTRVASANPRYLAKGDAPIYDVRVSTVFLGLDHNHFGVGAPLLFETMVFGGEHDGDAWRCSTWEEAEKQHAKACRSTFGPKLKVVIGGKE
jgi:hypothetical protein